MWQQLYADLADRNFMVVAVAEESRGADHARTWVEQAKATYWCLVDTDHRVSDLYAMVNVPQSVWIDEAGRIVRPPETAGSTDHFRGRDHATGTLAPELQQARQQARADYLAAVKDWATTGRYALPPEAVKRALPELTPEIAEAHARFRLAVWLQRNGRADEAAAHFAAASRLHPDSWSMWRQAADLEEVGKATGPEFWARVQALGDKPYYPPPDLPGFAAPRKN